MIKISALVLPGIFFKTICKKTLYQGFHENNPLAEGEQHLFFKNRKQNDTVIINSPAVYKPEYYLYYLKKPPWYWEPPAEGTTLCTPR
jgi:hypothetical protein